METVLIVIHLMVVLAMIVVVLLQRSEGGALGMGSSNNSGVTAVRGTANLLTRTTAILATVFLATSILLAILARNENSQSSILDVSEPETQVPSVPTGDGEAGTGNGNGILDTLRSISEPEDNNPQVPVSE